MRTYFRVLTQFGSPLWRFIVPYFVVAMGATFFGLANFTLLMPLLDILFSEKTVAQMQLDLHPGDWRMSFTYFGALFKYHLSQLVITHGKVTALKYLCIVLILSSIITNIFRYMTVRISEDFKARFSLRLRKVLFSHIINLHFGYFTENRKGDIISKFTSDAHELEGMVANSLVAFLKEPVLLVTYFTTLFVLSWELTLFTLILIPLSGLVISVIAKRLKKDSLRIQEAIGRVVSMNEEAFGGMRIIKGFNGEPYIKEKFDQDTTEFAMLNRRIAFVREAASPITEVLTVCAIAGILYYGGGLVLTKDSGLSASGFVTYIVAFSQLVQPLKNISSASSALQRGLVAARRVFDVLDVRSEVTDAPDAKPLGDFKEDIRFEKVSFSYGSRRVLHEVALDIPKGKMVALVGPSGGGKSTIADLIPRFYDVESGRILIDGQDLRSYTLHSVRNILGIVTQEPILFNDSILNNIAFAKPGATMEEVIAAAKVANAHDFIMATENGYHTHIGDRGSRLSGGQRQRLSIARAVLKNPPILILDEATSALDTESEKLVQEALTNLMKNRTSLVIAHRLSTIHQADRIYVIENGHVAEHGTHHELMQIPDGLYHKLNLMQNTLKETV